jgi:uncharacterized membrane protein YdjX (TVP38/TMEM64 family)
MSENFLLLWYKQHQTWVHRFIFRLLIRIVVIAALIFLHRAIGLDFLIDGYTESIASMGYGKAIPVFTVTSVLFTALSPTGYLPTILSGATFPVGIALPISYVSVICGAMLNMFLVRDLKITRFFCKCCRRLSEFQGVEKLVSKHPIRGVVFLRLPYLGLGVLNYLLSLTSISKKQALIGNLTGLLPGAILFTLVGDTARSILGMFGDGHVDAGAIVIVVMELVFVLVSIAGVVYLGRKKIKEQVDQDAQQEPAHLELAVLSDSPSTMPEQSPMLKAKVSEECKD